MTHFKRKGASTDIMVLTSLMWMLQCGEGNIKIFSVVIPVVLGLIAVPLFIITVLCLKQYCSADERRHRRVRARQSRRSESSHCTEINSSGVQKEFVTLDVNSFLPPTYDEALLGNFASSTENLCSKDDETEEPSSPPPYDIVASILGNHPSLSAEGGNADASTEATPAADCNSSIQGSTIHVNIIDVQEAGAPMTTDLVDHSVLISTPAQVDS
ncbi:uncharacterized protein LOC106163808 [Lingula anatina]|uniref:Uncharacterized protein LOC106163808 n=1 Tax=Lingula anatina TaxID=7574 RepID=A0A1S3IGF8_LINAN|nr:uncharacterized protein LOC106163808 [Lingula anatina]|eukprot:XP_013396951.1 uncharacterized protein LOC106163808 [Lingula anatina]